MIIFDTETSGLPKPPVAPLAEQPHIIELGLIVVSDDGKYKVLEEVGVFVKPPILIDEKALAKISGITNDMLRDAPTFVEQLNDLEELFRGQQKIVAHNAPFDMNMLVFELRRLGREYAFPYPSIQMCTAERSQSLNGGKRMSLIELYAATLGRELKQSHRALDDARALFEIVKKRKW